MGNDHKVAYDSFVSDSSTQDISLIDIPFPHRHQCWFCGEPSLNTFTFPHDFPLPKYQLDISPLANSQNIHRYHQGYVVLDCPHPTLKVPSCGECHTLALKVKAVDIWLVTKAVKSKLMQRYHKDLAIGVNWTKDELENSELMMQVLLALNAVHGLFMRLLKEESISPRGHYPIKGLRLSSKRVVHPLSSMILLIQVLKMLFYISVKYIL